MSCSEQTGSGESSDHQLVVDSWEEAGDEVSVQVEERQKQLLKKKHKEEEMRALREQAAAAQQNQITTVGDRQSGIKILRRPQSCGTLPSPSTRPEVPKTDETQQQQLQTQAKLKSLEERQAAYQQARERIFGKFNPDEEVETEADLGPTLVPLPPTTVNSPIAGIVPTPRMPAYSAGTVPIPRPRAPMAALRTIRAPHFQPIPASQGIVYTLPPPMGIYAGAVCPGMGATSQQPQQQQSQPHAYQAPSGMGATGLPLGGQRLPTPHHPIGASAAAAAAAVHHPVISHPPLPPHAQHMSTSYQPPIALPLGAPSGTTRLPGPPMGQVNASGISAGCPPPPPPPSLVPNSAAAVLTMNCPADPMRTSRAGAAAAGAATQPQSHQPVPFYDARVPPPLASHHSHAHTHRTSTTSPPSAAATTRQQNRLSAGAAVAAHERGALLPQTTNAATIATPQPQPPPSTIGSATPTSTTATPASGLVPGLISLLPGALSLKSSAGTGAVCPTSTCTGSGGGRSNGAQATLGRGLNGSLRGTPTTQKTGLYAGGTAVSTSASSSSSSAIGTNRVPYGRPPVQLLAQQPHFGSGAVASVPSGTQPTISPVAFNNAPAPNTSTSNY